MSEQNWRRLNADDLTPEAIAKMEAIAKAAEIADNGNHRTRSTDEIKLVKYSDDAIANQFSEQHKDDLRHVDQWGWLEWTGQRWRRIPDVNVMDHARFISRSVAQECTHEPLARSVASAKTVAAIVRLASGDERHRSDVEQWDRDLWLFNTPGGTIDLHTGQLRPHRREDYITKMANATPRGACPKWITFLKRITNNSDELQAYLQRLAGYALCGDPREECLDFFYGSGGNGKGTYLAALEYVFGEYATSAGKETFAESKNEKHLCGIAKLAGARLVVSNEVDEGQRWDEARIKELTGRGPVDARFMRQDLFSFLPQFTLIIAGNHKPSLKAVDEAIRRRFHLVPFTVTIPTNERNESLKKELCAEADGILDWAVTGCLEWQKQKLNPPEMVLTATAEYLEGEDTLQMWLDECCLTGHEGYEEPIALLAESCRQWKQERGERPFGRKTFTDKLTDRGFVRKRDKTGWKMAGLRLTDEERKGATARLESRKKQPTERDDETSWTA